MGVINTGFSASDVFIRSLVNNSSERGSIYRVGLLVSVIGWFSFLVDFYRESVSK